MQDSSHVLDGVHLDLQAAVFHLHNQFEQVVRILQESRVRIPLFRIRSVNMNRKPDPQVVTFCKGFQFVQFCSVDAVLLPSVKKQSPGTKDALNK